MQIEYESTPEQLSTSFENLRSREVYSRGSEVLVACAVCPLRNSPRDVQSFLRISSTCIYLYTAYIYCKPPLTRRRCEVVDIWGFSSLPTRVESSINIPRLRKRNLSTISTGRTKRTLAIETRQKRVCSRFCSWVQSIFHQILFSFYNSYASSMSRTIFFEGHYS